MARELVIFPRAELLARHFFLSTASKVDTDAAMVILARYSNKDFHFYDWFSLDPPSGLTFFTDFHSRHSAPIALKQVMVSETWKPFVRAEL